MTFPTAPFPTHVTSQSDEGVYPYVVCARAGAHGQNKFRLAITEFGWEIASDTKDVENLCPEWIAHHTHAEDAMPDGSSFASDAYAQRCLQAGVAQFYDDLFKRFAQEVKAATGNASSTKTIYIDKPK